MPETLTESFCERCGTRYVFDPPKPEPRRRSIGKALGLAHDSGAKGRTPTLDPFLATFRFCLGCRQYVCPECWNEHAGFCATCEPFPEAPPLQVMEPEVEAEVEGQHLHVGAEAWPLLDLARDGATAAVYDDGPDPNLAAAGEAYVVDGDRAVARSDVHDNVVDDSDVSELRERTLQAHADATDSTAPGTAQLTVAQRPSDEYSVTDDPAPPTHPVSPAAEAIEEPALANLVGEPAPEDRNHRDQELDVSWNHLLLVALPPSNQAVIEAPPADWRAAVVPFETMTAAPAIVGPPVETQPVETQPVETQPIKASLQTSSLELELEPLAEVEPERVPALQREQVTEPQAVPTAELQSDQVAEIEPVPGPQQIAEPKIEAVSEINAAVPESQDPVETAFAREPHPTEPHPTEPQVPVHVEPEAAPAEVVFPPAAPPALVVPAWRFTAPDQPRRDTAVQPVWRPGSPAETQGRPAGLDAPSAAEMPGAFYVPQAHGGGGTPAMIPQRASARPEMRASASSPASGVRPCGSCALPLSASARFCRRCGASQST